ncbi:hypothetical protein FLP41_09845 [Paracoccus marcusii]|uniref:hypothetical protein n=1 Tax=Paracoccus marcusii TaxID=59779 RepID=UPI002ED0E3D3|nr:hypothetical protein FLP41_09845 [Paracoccus marcusii]
MRPLAVALVVLGLGLAAASVIQVTLGLRSLDRLRADLARVRAGDSDRLARPDVSELRPWRQRSTRRWTRTRPF